MLIDARITAHLNPQEAADLCGLHRTAYRRQETGSSRVNLSCFRLLLMQAGFLPPPWEGWRLHDGQIWSPEGEGFAPGEIRAIPLMNATVAAYQARQRIEEPPLAIPDTGNIVQFRKREKK
ncbi:MAG: hypothetical protein KUF74_15790 [Candidatus Thiodiazotropha sp. (ex Ctena orbiculata)]|nr:hypothetical protein [Candidatus Thiodiazotropha taylori]